MGSCVSRNEKRSRLDPCIPSKDIQLHSSISSKSIQLDSSIPQKTPETVQPDVTETGWFDIPFDMRRVIMDLMDFEGKSILAQCSIDCFEEILQTRNYIRKIHVSGRGKKKDQIIAIYISAKKEKWSLMLHKERSGNYKLHWRMKNEIISKIIFRNRDVIDITFRIFNNIVKRNTKSLRIVEIDMDDFPFHRTNINNLKNQQLRDLEISEIENGINPISCGFINIDTISRFQHEVNIPNCQLDVLFKIQAKSCELYNPMFSLDEFDKFLKRLLIAEEINDHLEDIKLDLKGIQMNWTDLIRFIEKYTGPGEEYVDYNSDSEDSDEEEEEEDRKSVRFVCRSRKWENLEHRFVLTRNSLNYYIDYE